MSSSQVCQQQVWNTLTVPVSSFCPSMMSLAKDVEDKKSFFKHVSNRSRDEKKRIGSWKPTQTPERLPAPGDPSAAVGSQTHLPGHGTGLISIPSAVAGLAQQLLTHQ